jgi:hypothetical protein
LTAFTDVPWNAPYYERLGWRRLGQSDLTPGLAAIREHETARGLDITKGIVHIRAWIHARPTTNSGLSCRSALPHAAATSSAGSSVSTTGQPKHDREGAAYDECGVLRGTGALTRRNEAPRRAPSRGRSSATKPRPQHGVIAISNSVGPTATHQRVMACLIPCGYSQVIVGSSRTIDQVEAGFSPGPRVAPSSAPNEHPLCLGQPRP